MVLARTDHFPVWKCRDPVCTPFASAECDGIRCAIWKYYRNRVFAVDRNDTDRRDDR